MVAPTFDQLKEANPNFFSPKWGAAGEISDYLIEEEDGRFVFKVAAPHETFPVYAVGDDLKLSFLRHHWNVKPLN